MSNPSFMPAWRWPRAVRCGRSSFALGLLLAFALSGCAPQTVAPLPPATSLAVTAAPPATAAPPTAALQPTRASQPTVKVPSQPTQTAQPAGNADLLLTVMHTNDVGGETDPCGWGTPKGGLARRATAIKNERQSSKGIVLVLDAGNTLTGAWLTRNTQGAVMVEAMNAMGYDAMVVGQIDISLGLEQLKKLGSESKFPFLSANIVSKANNEPIFTPYTILERGGKKIAIIGLSDLQATVPLASSAEATVLDPVQSAQQLVGQLRSQVDLLIILSRLGIDADRALAQSVPGIDIIVGGNTRKLMPQPERAGDTLIIQQGYLGEWMGVLEVAYAQGKPIQAQERVISLTPDYQDDPEMAALLSKYAELYPTPTATPPFGLQSATSTPGR